LQTGVTSSIDRVWGARLGGVVLRWLGPRVWLPGLVLACHPASRAPVARYELAPKAYAKVVQEFTRGGSIYAQIETAATIDMTILDRNFRYARLRRESAMLRLAGPEFHSRWRAEQQADQEQLEFFVSVYTAEPRLNDLQRSRSTWQVWLFDQDEKAYRPDSIKQLSDKDLPLLTPFYPYLDQWRKAYLISFVRAKAVDAVGWPTAVRLEFWGTPGRLQLAWDRGLSQRE